MFAESLSALGQAQVGSQYAKFGGASAGIGYTPNYGDVISRGLPPEKKGFMKLIREYIEKHKDAIFTVGLVILLDHFIFGGAFRERIKNTVDKLLDKANKSLSGGSDEH